MTPHQEEVLATLKSIERLLSVIARNTPTTHTAGLGGGGGGGGGSGHEGFVGGGGGGQR